MFKFVVSTKASEKIIEQIRGAILAGKLKPGDKLPTEKNLIETFGVSKATLREALLSLEILGFLEIRKGASGGSYITEVNAEKARDSFINFLYSKNLSLESITEVRLLIEPYVAERGLSSVQDKDLRKLNELIKESEDCLNSGIISNIGKSDIEFHRTIASLTENPILMFVIDFVENILVDTKKILKPNKEFFQSCINAHRRIYEALLEKNAKNVREEMTNHVLEVEKELLALKREKSIGDFKLYSMTEEVY